MEAFSPKAAFFQVLGYSNSDDIAFLASNNTVIL